ncbi:hypothetical protein TNCV_3647761 [Trichonephila clavipes]|nr:hypothetical protein TNCV_3647761 [Trichonephila clavipes]
MIKYDEPSHKVVPFRPPKFKKGERIEDNGCKEPLPAPGNRSNERRQKKRTWQREEEKVGTGEKREGDGKSRGRGK